jgi:Nif-specific regulatory protein
VRELENCVERTATMTRTYTIQDVDLPCQQNKCFSQVLQHYGQVQQAAPVIPTKFAPREIELPSRHETDDSAACDPSDMSERERLVWAMEQCGWVQAKAARLLNLTPRQIGYALQKYNIEVKRL